MNDLKRQKVDDSEHFEKRHFENDERSRRHSNAAARSVVPETPEAELRRRPGHDTPAHRARCHRPRRPRTASLGRVRFGLREAPELHEVGAQDELRQRERGARSKTIPDEILV